MRLKATHSDRCPRRGRCYVPAMTEFMHTPRSRLRRQPRGKRVLLSPRDIETFRLLDRYRYLPSNFIHSFVGGHPTYHKARMTDLFHEGWLDKPRPQWEALNARYRPDTYELGAKACAVLADQGELSAFRLGTGSSYRHELMVCLVMASIELAARHAGIALRGWKDVLVQAPEKTRNAQAPFSIPISVKHADRTVSGALRPDGLPFALQSRRSFWFVGFEADRHTEPLHPVDLHSRSSSILGKFLQYRQLVKQRNFESHYGMSNILVPIITRNEAHMRNMMDLALTITDGQGFKWMLFKTIANFASLEQTPQPQWDILEAPWHRAGNPPLNLLVELTRE